jgi:DNA-directed RNA polymerase subunit K/omega
LKYSKATRACVDKKIVCNNLILLTSFSHTHQKQEKKMETSKVPTKYEIARLLGTRARQLSLGAPSFVSFDGETDVLAVAMKEIKERNAPIVIRRFFPNGSHEDLRLQDADLDATVL